MVDRAEAYFLYFKAVQGLEDVLDFIEEVTDKWDDEIEYFRSELDRISDVMIALAISHDWSHAFRESGFQELWLEYEDFASENFRPYFEDGFRS